MATSEYTPTTTRTQRGIKLAAEHAAEIIDTGNSVYRVPGSRPVPYTVNLTAGFCSCPDHQHSGHTCKHLIAAQIIDSREACRRRKPRKADRSHRADSLRGITVDVDRLDLLAARLGV